MLETQFWNAIRGRDSNLLAAAGWESGSPISDGEAAEGPHSPGCLCCCHSTATLVPSRMASWHLAWHQIFFLSLGQWNSERKRRNENKSPRVHIKQEGVVGVHWICSRQSSHFAYDLQVPNMTRCWVPKGMMCVHRKSEKSHSHPATALAFRTCRPKTWFQCDIFEGCSISSTSTHTGFSTLQLQR